MIAKVHSYGFSGCKLQISAPPSHCAQQKYLTEKWRIRFCQLSQKATTDNPIATPQNFLHDYNLRNTGVRPKATTLSQEKSTHKRHYQTADASYTHAFFQREDVSSCLHHLYYYHRNYSYGSTIQSSETPRLTTVGQNTAPVIATTPQMPSLFNCPPKKGIHPPRLRQFRTVL